MVTLDSGAVVTLMSSAFFQELKPSSESLVRRRLDSPGVFECVVGKVVLAHDEFILDFKFDTPGGPLALLRVPVWVGQLPKGVGDVLLADEVMSRLGYDHL
ncbi:hypothetical protein PHMEG_00025969 [Phytophthora megakarya]|uniref:Peptidase A2 domain-containing protein n=1 Tax=Phytophthora megakarya TaxID=4795 RepID=A0A225VAQ6_9STRA|nr:hypothetical protein PHMEG_00025969 [Phytophthora megakarya]